LPDGKVENPGPVNSREKLCVLEVLEFALRTAESSATSTSFKSTAETVFRRILKIEFKWGKKVVGTSLRL
jgi:hypothetical protein